MAPPKALIELIERFDRNIDAYKSGSYNETQVRREFIDPFFTLLGWDMDNTQGYAEAYKDVVHEDAIKIGGSTKAPDYCFRVGGTRKFFLEAKKPQVNIKDDVSPAFQLRRYAWSGKLPLSILTDFEEFAVYDCRMRPVKTDKVTKGRTLYLNYKEYPQRWEEIASVFSRDAVLKGSFDKYAESAKAKKGTAEVDVSFLRDIESWRENLARNLALRNPNLTQRELNFAVQRIIDRIIFLRIGEDRGIENYGRLMALQNGSDVYQRLCGLFREADNRYNSGLFHFQEEKGRPAPDQLTLNLAVDDKVLKDIFKSFYYPESPYEFSVLPADILGQVYEQFLGKVIRLTSGHRALVEDKPEVKKAGGVFYTPTYIVDYIVEQTVGKLLEGKKPGPRGSASKIKILDPACGSGSFLIGAYQHLLDWHRDCYLKAGPQKHKKEIYQGQGREWRLTTAERKRILLNNIYGVDIDSQAVETTKLSLFLKVLEGESGETLTKQWKLLHERALPDLGNNIKCGNSLIGPDFYDGKQLGLFGEEERHRVNVFDWDAEFPEIMESGGFDVLIGNPPYGMVQDSIFLPYIESKFQTIEGRYEIYELFIEKGLSLCPQKGLLSFIVPNTLLTNLYTRNLRRFLKENTHIKQIVNFGMDVFSDPTVHTCILLLELHSSNNGKVYIRKQVLEKSALNGKFDYQVLQKELGNNENSTFDVFLDPQLKSISDKMSSNSRLLGDLCYIRQCIKTGNDKEYVKCIDKEPSDPWKPTLQGRGMERYKIKRKDLYLKYGKWLARNWKNKTFYETPKIAVRETGSIINATLDVENRYFLSSLYSVYFKEQNSISNLLYILGILNSRIATFFMHLIALGVTKGAFTKIRTNQLARLPIPKIAPSNPADKSRHERMVSLVDQMLELNKQFARSKTSHDQTVLKRQIDATDRQIDQLVYELYGLTKEEIKIVEESKK